MHVDDFKLFGKKQIIDQKWEEFMKEVDWKSQHHALTMFILGCSQREREMSKEIVDNYRNTFESRISAGAKEKILCFGTQTSLHGPMTWKVTQRNVKNNSAACQSRNSMH